MELAAWLMVVGSRRFSHTNVGPEVLANSLSFSTEGGPGLARRDQKTSGGQAAGSAGPFASTSAPVGGGLLDLAKLLPQAKAKMVGGASDAAKGDDVVDSVEWLSSAVADFDSSILTAHAMGAKNK